MNPVMLENIRHQFPWAHYVRESVHVTDVSMTIWFEVSHDGQAWIDLQTLQAHRPVWGELLVPTAEEIAAWTRESMKVLVETLRSGARHVRHDCC